MFKNGLENYARYLTITGEGTTIEEIFIQYLQGIKNDTRGAAFKQLAASFTRCFKGSGANVSS